MDKSLKFIYQNLEPISGIYIIKNGDKIYVGFSKNIRSRVQEHLNRLSENVHYVKTMQTDWNEDNTHFRAYIIEATTDKQREHYWTLHYNSNKTGYNTNIGAKRPQHIQDIINSKNTGQKRSIETKQKLSDSLKGRPGNKGTTGLKFSLETRQKMSDSAKRSHAKRGHM